MQTDNCKQIILSDNLVNFIMRRKSICDKFNKIFKKIENELYLIEKCDPYIGREKDILDLNKKKDDISNIYQSCTDELRKDFFISEKDMCFLEENDCFVVDQMIKVLLKSYQIDTLELQLIRNFPIEEMYRAN
jgi:hypothetical protein